MVYGYARCSTNESKQDIDRQKRELINMGVESDNIYWEYESGANADRVQLKRLLDTVQSRDTIVTTEVSRLTRSMKHLCEIIQSIQDKKICLKIGSFVADCRDEEMDAMTQGMIMMWGVFAQMERRITSDRVKSGMKNAKAKGRHIGRPALSEEMLPKKFFKYYPKYKDEQMTLTDFAKVLGCTRKTLYSYIRVYEGK